MGALRTEIILRGPSPMLATRLDVSLARHPLHAIAAVDRPYFQVAAAYAAAACATCLTLDLGRAFDAASQPDSAIVAYERFISTPWFERAEGQNARYSPHVHRRLGELYDGRGDKERAL